MDREDSVEGVAVRGFVVKMIIERRVMRVSRRNDFLYFRGKENPP